jgi:hypothetical protein
MESGFEGTVFCCGSAGKAANPPPPCFVLQPEIFPKEDAEKLLDERITRALRTSWPLPVAKYLRGFLTETELEAAWRAAFPERSRDIVAI